MTNRSESRAKGPTRVFDIYDKRDATVVEILQSVTVNQSSFVGGFVVKGIRVTGVTQGSHGMIEYHLDNPWKGDQHPQAETCARRSRASE
jgi:hypothetical protein